MKKEELTSLLEHQCAIDPASRILVGVSGGPDSVFLLHLLSTLSYHLIVAHVNYHTRGLDSLKDEKLVQTLCDRFHVTLFIHRVPKKSCPSKGIEAWARDIRYSFFHHIAERKSCDAVAVAHTADDQAETIMLHLLRGAGFKGLLGMNIREYSGTHDITIIRPLLRITRSDILEYLKRHNIAFRIDRSNEQNLYTRNKIRNKLIPYINKEFSIDFAKRLRTTAQALRHDYRFLEKQTKHAFEDLTRTANALAHSQTSTKPASSIEFNLEKWNRLDHALKKRVLLMACRKINGHQRNITQHILEDALQVLKHGKQDAQMDLPGFLILRKKYDNIQILTRDKDVSSRKLTLRTV